MLCCAAPFFVKVLVYCCVVLLCGYQVGINLIAVKATELLSKYFGQTESTIRHIFQQARAAAPSLLLIDDFDIISMKR